LKTGRDVPIDQVSLCLGGDDCSCTSSCRYIGMSVVFVHNYNVIIVS